MFSSDSLDTNDKSLSETIVETINMIEMTSFALTAENSSIVNSMSFSNSTANLSIYSSTLSQSLAESQNLFLHFLFTFLSVILSILIIGLIALCLHHTGRFRQLLEGYIMNVLERLIRNDEMKSKRSSNPQHLVSDKSKKNGRKTLDNTEF